MSWDAINLAKIEERLPLGPTVGEVGLIYPGKRHVFSGPPESAKTLAAYVIALAVIRTGGHVLLIDFEMGPYEARDRLLELGATETNFELLHYVEPETPATKQTMSDLLTWEPSLVIIDAAAGAYDLQGLDDNKRGNVEEFMRLWIEPFRLRDVATIVIDHVTKSPENRGKFAIGSERKVGSADVHLGFETVEPVRRGSNGLYHVVVHKDRLGYLHRPKAAEFVLTSDPETHAITATFVLATSDQAEGESTFRPTHLMEQASRFLESQTEPVSRTRIAESVHGRATWVRKAIDALVHDGYATETGGRGGARLVATTRPFREGVFAPPTAPEPSQPSDPVPDPSRTGPEHPVRPSVPLVGTGDGAADGTTEPVQAELPPDAPPWEREWHERHAPEAVPDEPPEPSPDDAEAREAEGPAA